MILYYAGIVFYAHGGKYADVDVVEADSVGEGVIDNIGLL